MHLDIDAGPGQADRRGQTADPAADDDDLAGAAHTDRPRRDPAR
jgi:hypothetical protein